MSTDEAPPTAEATRLMLLDLMRRQQAGEEITADHLRPVRQGMREHRPLSKPLPVADPVVYYFRVGNRIKIGYTGNLEGRVKNLMPEEVLGWEPGPPSLEKKRHRQFASHRTAREWFEDCPAIRRHIEGNCQRP